MTETQSAQFKLLWEQTFKAAEVDAQAWNFDLGDGTLAGIPGWGNQEREYYRPENAKTGDGLTIEALRMPADNGLLCYYGAPAEWTSSKLHTLGKVHFQYGRIEARIQAPSGGGTWPAFWMLGVGITHTPWPQCGEIDIFEARGDLPTTVYGTLHGPGYSGADPRGMVWDSGTQISEGFHTYSIDWLPGEITWRFDGEVFFHQTREDISPLEWVYDQPFYIVLNLAMGGHFTGPIDEQLNRAELRVDYIRHYSINGVGTNQLVLD